MLASEKIDQLAAALAKAQAEMPPVNKTKTARVQMKSGGTYTFDYADLADVLDVVRGVLSANSLAVVQGADVIDGRTLLTTRLMHASGQWIESKYAMAAQGTPQEKGSELTYLRRYTLCAMLGIAAEEDDDGNGASGNTASVHKRQAPAPKQPAATPAQSPEDKHAGYLARVEQLIAEKKVPRDWLKKVLEKAGVSELKTMSVEQLETLGKTLSGKKDQQGKAA